MSRETTVEDVAEGYRRRKLLDSDKLFVATITDVGVTERDTIVLALTIGDKYSFHVSIPREQYQRYATLCDALDVPYDSPYKLTEHSLDINPKDSKVLLPTLDIVLPRVSLSPADHEAVLTPAYADAIKRRAHHDTISTKTITSVDADEDRLVLTLDWHGEMKWTVDIPDDMRGKFQRVVEEVGGGDVELLEGSAVTLRADDDTFNQRVNHSPLHIDSIRDPLTRWLIYPTREDARKKHEYDPCGTDGQSSSHGQNTHATSSDGLQHPFLNKYHGELGQVITISGIVGIFLYVGGRWQVGAIILLIAGVILLFTMILEQLYSFTNSKAAKK